jgi:hypothetical protein
MVSLFPWPEPGPAFVRHSVAIPPGQSLVHHDGEWRDALVMLQEGVIDLESVRGSCCRLRPGAIFWLTGLQLRSVHNTGRTPAVLIAVRRHTPAADKPRRLTGRAITNPFEAIRRPRVRPAGTA